MDFSPSPDLSEMDTSKFSYLPLQEPHLDKYYQIQKAQFWTPQELDFSKERADWEKLDEDSQKFLEFILCFFSCADGIVMANLTDNFQKELGFIKEAANFFIIQNAIELIHNETYSLLIETLIQDPDKKAKCFDAIQHYPAVRRIAAWMLTWMNSEKPILERIIAFCCVEGIFFNGAFAGIYWIKRQNLLKGLTSSNEFIARDESLHVQFAVALYHTLTSKKHNFEPLSTEKVHEIISSAISVATEFNADALRVDLIGMNCDEMNSYNKCAADNLITSLGYEELYGAKNPFLWMLIINLPNKTNFFEKRVTEYAKLQTSYFKFTTDVDF